MKENKYLQDIDVYLEKIDYAKEKVLFLKSQIPDLQVKILTSTTAQVRFAAKSVNQNYTGLDFRKSYETLSVIPFQELDFTHNNVTEKIKVYSNPGSSRLVYITRRYDKVTGHMLYSMKFSKMAINFKNNNFSDSMLNACRVEILNFMKKQPNIKADTKHMDPKLKNLMAFV